MTSRLYTREEMVEAYVAGAERFTEICDVEMTERATDRGIRYVDGLQDGRETPQKAREKSQIPGMAPEDVLTLLIAYKADLEEFKRTANDRTVAVARTLGRVLLETMLRVQFREPTDHGGHLVDHERAFENIVDWMTRELNTYFPELTEGAEWTTTIS